MELKIDYKEIAKNANLTYDELLDELMYVSAAHMSLQCKKHNGGMMKLIIEDFGTLTFEAK